MHPHHLAMSTPDIEASAAPSELGVDVVVCVLRALDSRDAQAAAATCKAWADAWRTNLIQRHGIIYHTCTLPRMLPWKISSPPPGSLPAEADYHRQACIPRPGIESGVREELRSRCGRLSWCTLLGVQAFCVLPDGRICACVADGVTVLSPHGYTSRITDAGQMARPGAGLRNATSIATDGKSLFVVDTSVGIIFRYSLTDFRLLRCSDYLYSGDCEEGHHIAIGGGRVFYTAGVSHGWSSRDEDCDTSLVHVFNAETLEELTTFPTCIKNTQPSDRPGRESDSLEPCGPGAIAFYQDELFLADVSDSKALVQVFDLHGNHLRSIFPPLGEYHYYEDGDIPEDGRPSVWRTLGTPGSLCVANDLIYLVIEEQTVDCHPDHEMSIAACEDRTATAVLVMSLAGEWRQLYFIEDDSQFEIVRLTKLSGVQPFTEAWSLAPGPGGTVLLAESRYAEQPPGASGYCTREGWIHVLGCKSTCMHWHQPCLRSTVPLHPSAKRKLTDGFRIAMTTLVFLLLKKLYVQHHDLGRLRHMRLWKVNYLAMDAIRSG